MRIGANSISKSEFCIVEGIRGAEGISETSEDWDPLVSFLPDDWTELAAVTGALKGLRKERSADGLLRTLTVHLERSQGCDLLSRLSRAMSDKSARFAFLARTTASQRECQDAKVLPRV